MTFVPKDVLDNLGSLTEKKANGYDYGVVGLDSKGKILVYNQYESDLGEVAIEEAHGKNFFLEVAPCTNNSLFKGKFEEGIKKGKLDEEFEYTFTYKIDPTNVLVHMVHDPDTSTNWVFIKRDED